MKQLQSIQLNAPFTLRRTTKERAWRVISAFVALALVAQTTMLVRTLPGMDVSAGGKSQAEARRQNSKSTSTSTSDVGGSTNPTPADDTQAQVSSQEPADTKDATGSFKVDLQQWADQAPANWQHGDLNRNNSDYQEGDSVPFRLDLPEVSSGSDYVLRVRYDFEKKDPQAYDFLTSYDRSRSPGPIPAGPPVTLAIPTDDSLGFAQVPGSFSLWGGTFAGAMSGPTVDVHEKYYQFTVHATSDTMTLMWGGHLASAENWGQGRGAGSIPGAPFHMSIHRIFGDRETSSQDRSIHLDQIQPTPPEIETGVLKVKKIVVGSEQPSSDWQLSVKLNDQNVVGSPAAGSATGTKYTLAPGSYLVSETGPAGYTVSYSPSCPNGVALVEAGQTTVCTLTNTKIISPGPEPVYAITLDKSGPATITAGNEVTYSLAWNVTGNTAVTNAIITDPLPANTSFVSADQGGAMVNNMVSWNLGTKNPGQSGTVSVTVTTTSPIGNGTIVTNTACFDSAETNQTCDTTTTTIQSAPQLSITKTNSVATFTTPGQAVIYTVTVSNASTATESAYDVVMTDVLPSGFIYTIGGGTTKSFPLGTIQPGGAVTTTYTATISPTQANGTYTNTASAKGTNTTNISATSAVEIRVPQVLGVTAEPDLTITKSVNTPTTNPGKTLTYTITVTNISEVTATNLVITDKLPAGFTFVDGGTRTMTWNLDKLAAGKSVSIPFKVKVGQNVKAGTHTNVASVVADDVDKQEAKRSVRVAVPQVLGLATTGVSARDYLTMAFGLGLIAAGVIWYNRMRSRYGTNYI